MEIVVDPLNKNKISLISHYDNLFSKIKHTTKKIEKNDQLSSIKIEAEYSDQKLSLIFVDKIQRCDSIKEEVLVGFLIKNKDEFLSNITTMISMITSFLENNTNIEEELGSRVSSDFKMIVEVINPGDDNDKLKSKLKEKYVLLHLFDYDQLKVYRTIVLTDVNKFISFLSQLKDILTN